jgi:hypothetical protein
MGFLRKTERSVRAFCAWFAHLTCTGGPGRWPGRPGVSDLEQLSKSEVSTASAKKPGRERPERLLFPSCISIVRQVAIIIRNLAEFIFCVE